MSKIDYFLELKTLLLILIMFIFLASCSSDRNRNYQYQQYDSYSQPKEAPTIQDIDSQSRSVNNPNQYNFPNSRYYNNPYALPPQNQYPYYDGDQYYVPPTYYGIPRIN